jgi:hypothetical protein
MCHTPVEKNMRETDEANPEGRLPRRRRLVRTLALQRNGLPGLLEGERPREPPILF